MDSAKRELKKIVAALSKHKLPASLEIYAQGKIPKAQTRLIDEAYTLWCRQISDMLSLPDGVWKDFKRLSEHLTVELYCLIGEVGEHRKLISKNDVKTYLEATFLEGNVPHDLIDRHSSAGSFVTMMYERLLDIYKDTELEPILQRVGHWDTAALDIVCDPKQYYQRTRSGTERTASEFIGSSILSCVPMKRSPLATDGRYYTQTHDAIDHKLLENSRLRDSEMMRQCSLIDLARQFQGMTAREPQEYWTALENAPCFIKFNKARAKYLTPERMEQM